MVEINYKHQDFMEPTTLATTTAGFLLNLDGITYVMQWVDSMLKVTGPDVCYYLVETARGLEQMDCHLQTFTLLAAN